MNKITLLPKWVFSGTTPSVYDTESGTCIEMTAKVYNAMRELQTSYNEFADEINTTITEYLGEFDIVLNKVALTDVVPSSIVKIYFN